MKGKVIKIIKKRKREKKREKSKLFIAKKKKNDRFHQPRNDWFKLCFSCHLKLDSTHQYLPVAIQLPLPNQRLKSCPHYLPNMPKKKE